MTTPTRTKGGARIAGRLLGLVLQVVPAAYVMLTGQAPWWIRVWLAVWLSLWLLLTVIQSAKAPGTESGHA